MNEGRRVLPRRHGAGEPGGLRPPGTAIRSSVTGSDGAADGVSVFPMRDPADGSDLLAEPRLQRSCARQSKSISEQRVEAKRGQSHDVIIPLFWNGPSPPRGFLSKLTGLGSAAARASPARGRVRVFRLPGRWLQGAREQVDRSAADLIN